MKHSVREPVAVVQVGFNKELDKADLWNLEGVDRRWLLKNNHCVLAKVLSMVPWTNPENNF